MQNLKCYNVKFIKSFKNIKEPVKLVLTIYNSLLFIF